MQNRVYDVKANTTHYYVEISTQDKYGWFEHTWKGDADGGGLWFDDDKNLIDYDGVFELSAEVCNALKKAGYKVGEEFYPDDTEALNAIRAA